MTISGKTLPKVIDYGEPKSEVSFAVLEITY